MLEVPRSFYLSQLIREEARLVLSGLDLLAARAMARENVSRAFVSRDEVVDHEQALDDEEGDTYA